MSNLTQTATAGVLTGARRANRRNRASVKLNQEAFQFIEGEVFTNDYDLIAALVTEYNGKDISEYEREKTREIAGVSVTYSTARFPQADKDFIMKKLLSCIEVETFKKGTKVSGYEVKAVNHEAVSRMIEKEEYFARR